MASGCCKIVFVLLLLGVCSSIRADNVATTLVARVLQMSDDLNVAFSPKLLIENLLQLYLGAKGDTAAQISKFLQLYTRSPSRSTQRPRNREGSQFSASQILISKDIPVLSSYKNAVRNAFNTEIRSVDFQDYKQTGDIFFKWFMAQLSQFSNQHFNDFSKQQFFASDNQLVIFSVSAFVGIWRCQFQEIVDRPFISKSSNDPVTTIVNKGLFKYKFVKELNSHALDLPYKTSNMSMLILLPVENDGLKFLEHELAEVSLEDISPTTLRQMYFTLPKFEIQTSLHLNNVLKTLGVKKLFDSPDLSGISGNTQNLNVSEIVQFLNVRVDEKSASATSSQDSFFPRSYPFELEINHPFIYMIKDESQVYQAGKISEVDF